MKKNSLSFKSLSALLLVAAAGCLDGSTGVEDEAESVGSADGSADSAGIAEDSVDATTVLAAANTFSYDHLVDSNGVGLSKRAAAGIVAARPFVTLADLDRVRYVGAVTMARLLEAGDSITWQDADAFSSASCGGLPMNFEQARARFSPGATEVVLGSTRSLVQHRVRSCNPTTGCTPWQPAPVEKIESLGGSGHGEVADLVDNQATLTTKLQVNNGKIDAVLAAEPKPGKPMWTFFWEPKAKDGRLTVGTQSSTSKAPTLSLGTTSWSTNGRIVTQMLPTKGKMTLGQACVRYYAVQRDTNGMVVGEYAMLSKF